MKHVCHTWGCSAECPPRHLMCAPCWATIPGDLQREVYRTVKLRGKSVDATWSAWWRAQAEACAIAARALHHEVARPTSQPLPEVVIAAKLTKDLEFADLLDTRRP